jgi:hypothetical protein
MYIHGLFHFSPLIFLIKFCIIIGFYPSLLEFYMNNLKLGVWCLSLSVLFFSSDVYSGSLYDQYGGSQGSTDSSGNFYDNAGGSQGSTDSYGNIYDNAGGSQGSVDSYGNIYDNAGGSQGSVDSDGDVYDNAGGYVGSYE